jgi:hypothetical protein
MSSNTLYLTACKMVHLRRKCSIFPLPHHIVDIWYLPGFDYIELYWARRRLAFKDINSNSWFTEVKSLMWKYDLPEIYWLLESPYTKYQWKKPILLEFYLRLLLILFWYRSMDVVYLVCIFLYWGNLYSYIILTFQSYTFSNNYCISCKPIELDLIKTR